MRRRKSGSLGPVNPNDLCKEHGFPLTQMCKECYDKYVCEVCSVEGDHRFHEVINLRQLIVDIMKKFEDNFVNFEHQFTKIRYSKVADYRASINQEFEEFFTKIH